MSLTYSVGEMAKKLGKSVKTLQNWDKKGVLRAFRSPSNRRYYSHEQYLEASGKTKYKCTGTDLDSVRDKTVLITGGTGSLGHALVKRIHHVAKKIIVFSRCELKQANMKQKFADKTNMRYLIGDIRDKERLLTALRGVDVCIHAACMKRVETCTYNPLEAIKSNVIGSMNVLEACIENKVSKTLLVSSDKACAPATLYGGTKFVAEQIFINGNNYATRDCLFTATRYGNVYASNGSVRHLFERQAKEEGKVKVTHKDMTRFFMSMDAAVDLNLFALNNTIGGEIFIPKLKATTIMSFAETFAPGVPVEFIGLRGYEKIHEDLISATEMLYVVDCGEYYKVVPPGVSDWTLGWDISYPDESKIDPFEYSSRAVEQFTSDELKEFDQ
jgi:FlaA1/EpsC-like NDP-sugar epimerase